ncbi:MAG: fatty acid desaturase [Candidatus Omnitrophica bacterium]|nr:fatty acid desaturase [Candidatus Omnitrophota bacterium]
MNIKTTSGPIRENIWLNIIFFSGTTVAALIGCPFYLSRFGISSSEIFLFIFYLWATGISVTAGYHRLFSHVTYKAHPLVEFFFLFFGAAAFEMSALGWSSQHRDHHRYVDTENDPYNIKKGFFYAHIGWLIFWKHRSNLDNVRDLQKNSLVMHQDKHYLLWAVSSGILMPLVLGFLSGHLLGAFLFSICLRLTVVYHSTFAINSVCHMFGKATYDIYATAKDHWLVAFLTNGEGYHNFHHRFPGDYRNGVRWYQWDPSKWLIGFLSWFGLSRDLKRVSDFRILEARLAAEQQMARDSADKIFESTNVAENE